jgi:dolichol kinase
MEKKRELKRQLFHTIAGSIIIALFYFNIMTLTLFAIIILTGIIIRLAWKKQTEPIITWFLHNFERNGEAPGKGAMWFCIGMFIVIFLFEKNIAYASIMILALGDATSHYIGRFYGKIKHPLNKKRNLEGTIVGTLIGSMGAMLFVSTFPALIAAFVAMNVETVEWKIGKYKIDDNLIIPIVAAIVLTLI